MLRGAEDVTVLLIATTIAAVADQFEGVLWIPNQETTRTPFGTRIAMTVRNKSCLENAPLLREAVHYRTLA
jgi:hypothetical protein